MKEGADFSGVTHYTQVDVQPGGINIQNVEHLYQADILKQLGIELEVKRKGEAAPDERQQKVIELLKPIFYGVEEEAQAFLTSIQGMKGTQITAKVNQLVVEKKISDMSQHRELWKVLSDYGFYDKSESNWNQQVK